MQRLHFKKSNWGIVLCLLSVLALAGCERNSELKDFTSDGCSLFPDGTLMGKDEWCECCFEHDIAYWQGGTEEQRLLADLALRECVLEKTGSEELAELMFQGVRAGGSPYFYNWYRWGYGWSDRRNYRELTAADKELVELKLEKFYSNPTYPCKD
jgi:hypothetical protein